LCGGIAGGGESNNKNGEDGKKESPNGRKPSQKLTQSSKTEPSKRILAIEEMHINHQKTPKKHQEKENKQPA